MTALQTATLKVARKRRNDLESQHQRALIEWAQLASIPGTIPGIQPGARVIEYLFAVPNGGARSKATAGKLKAEGVKAGVWDLMLALPLGRKPGLWIEMKAGKNTLTAEQRDWRERMKALGYECAVCWDWTTARDAILGYLGAAPTKTNILATLDDAEEGELAHPKDKPARSEKYRRLVAALPCANCSIEGHSQAAHPNTGKGMSQKASDNLCFPLCGPRPDEAGCHARFDQGAMYSRQERRALEAKWGEQTARQIRNAGKWPMGLPRPEFKG